MRVIGGVDIGGTKIAVGMVSETGELLAQQSIPTDAERGPEDGLKRIVSLLRATAEQAGIAPSGVGIGSTGPVYPLSGTIGQVEYLPGWEGFNLVQELERALGVPVAMENDADAAALGEFSWGAGQGARRFIYVTFSTGIGVGLVFDGELYRGVADSHPEIGHQVIDPSGPACYCGAHGCWESLASGTALSEFVKGRWPVSNGDQSPPTAQEICAAAEKGNLLALEAVKRTGGYLALGLANLVICLAPDVMVLGGGLMRSRHLFWDTIQATIRQNCWMVPVDQLHLAPAAFGTDAGLIGAAGVWLYRYAWKNF